MKKISIYTLGLCLSLNVLLLACSVDLDSSKNGDLDGYWHITAIDTISTGGVKDLSNVRLFWAFQKDLLDVRDVDSMRYHYLLRFVKLGSVLQLSQPYIYDRMNPAGDVPLTDSTFLMRFGINRLEERFLIEHLGSGTMLLRSDSLRISFRKL